MPIPNLALPITPSTYTPSIVYNPNDRHNSITFLSLTEEPVRAVDQGKVVAMQRDVTLNREQVITQHAWGFATYDGGAPGSIPIDLTLGSIVERGQLLMRTSVEEMHITITDPDQAPIDAWALFEDTFRTTYPNTANQTTAHIQSDPEPLSEDRTTTPEDADTLQPKRARRGQPA